MSTPGIPVKKPITLKTATVVFQHGTEPEQDFSDHISKIALTPSTGGGQSWTSANGKVINSSPISTWQADLELVQDMDPTGFLRYLLSNDGVKVVLKATFEDGLAPLTATVTLAAAAIGGAADGKPLTSTVTLPVDGKPAFGAVPEVPEG